MMKKTSLKFKHISMNTTKLVFNLLFNQNLLRYIHYLGDYNPLDERIPNVEASVVKDNNFILTKFNDKIITDTKIFIFVNPFRGRFTGSATADDFYEISIIVPREYWLIKNTSQLRAFEIAYEIGQSVDQKNIAGIGNVEIVNWDTFKASDSHDGLVLLLQVTNGTVTV